MQSCSRTTARGKNKGTAYVVVYPLPDRQISILDIKTFFSFVACSACDHFNIYLYLEPDQGRFSCLQYASFKKNQSTSIVFPKIWLFPVAPTTTARRQGNVRYTVWTFLRQRNDSGYNGNFWDVEVPRGSFWCCAGAGPPFQTLKLSSRLITSFHTKGPGKSSLTCLRTYRMLQTIRVVKMFLP